MSEEMVAFSINKPPEILPTCSTTSRILLWHTQHYYRVGVPIGKLYMTKVVEALEHLNLMTKFDSI